MKEGPLYRYIGESSRSTYERGSEHLADLKYRRTRSHLLRHCVEVHEGEDPDKIEFRMKQIGTFKSAFERQLAEAVLIEKYNGPLLLNSKLEYNRCCIPKITMKLGNKEEKEDPDKEREKSNIEKIKMLFKGEKKREKTEEDIGLQMLDKRKKIKLGEVMVTDTNEAKENDTQSHNDYKSDDRSQNDPKSDYSSSVVGGESEATIIVKGGGAEVK